MVAAADEELEDLTVSHPARERPVGTDLGHEADAAEGEDELRAVGCNHEIARERPGEGDTGDGAVQRNDDRSVGRGPALPGVPRRRLGENRFGRSCSCVSRI
jgi:hypothetical protein